MFRHIRLSAVLVAAISLAMACGAHAHASPPHANNPILIVQDGNSPDPYQNFVSEMLLTEGLNEFDAAQLPQLTQSFLAHYDVVVLPHLAISDAEATLFEKYVATGGVLIGFRPDVRLAEMFGVHFLGRELPEGWLKIDTNTSLGTALDKKILKYHGAADLYRPNGAAPLGMLYEDFFTPTPWPAATINVFGLGKAILFSFDLTKSIVLMRQGNPEWAGYPNDHDGHRRMRPSQMFMDEQTKSFWNDRGDGALNDTPQADEQLRLFSNAVVLSAMKKPIPRLWYFPNRSPALLLMTGDHHGDPEANSASEIEMVSSYGGAFNEFLWYPFGAIGNDTVTKWLSAGDSFGVHFNDTAETDESGLLGAHVTWNGMDNVMSKALGAFAANFPDAPKPVTARTHYILWLSNDADGAPDQTAQAKLFQEHGIEWDASFSAYPDRWGYMSGSGLPMKFLDTKTGMVIPVYEQATQYEDDDQLDAKGLNWDLPIAAVHYRKTLSESLHKYNEVTVMLFHPDEWKDHRFQAETALEYAQSESIPMPSAGHWLAFWKQRAGTQLSDAHYSRNTLTFNVHGGPEGLSVLVPAAFGDGVISELSVDSRTRPLAVGSYQGIAYASAVLERGDHTIMARYGPAGADIISRAKAQETDRLAPKIRLTNAETPAGMRMHAASGNGKPDLNAFDLSIDRFLNGFAQRSWTADAAIVSMASSGFVSGGIMLAMFWWAWFAYGGANSENRSYVLSGFLAAVISVVVARTASLTLPFRIRPIHNPLLYFRLPYTMSSGTLIHWNSFPSDHAALFVSLAVILCFISIRLGIAALCYVFLGVALPLVYAGIHYPSDILGGALVGVGVAFLFRIASLRRALTRPALRYAEQYPGYFYPIFFLFAYELSDLGDSVRHFVLILAPGMHRIAHVLVAMHSRI